MTDVESQRGWLNSRPALSPFRMEPGYGTMGRLLGVAIIDGPDGVGKTTLARNVALDAIEMPQVARFGPAKDPARIFEHFMADMLALGGLPAIADRMHASSWAYGKVFRGKPDMDEHAMLCFERQLAMNAEYVHLFVVTSHKDWALANLRKKHDGAPTTAEEELYEDPAQWDAVNDGILEWYEKSTLSKTLIHMDQHSPGDAAMTVLRTMEWVQP